MKNYKKRNCCSICKSKKLIDILDLGNVPLAGYFPKKEELEEINLFPLKLQFCENCKLIQTDSVINPDTLFRDYRYLSSIGLTNHFNDVAYKLNEKYNVVGKEILEFGCNDGVLMKPLSNLGAKIIGVDPSINVTKIARDKGLNVITEYFNYKTFGSSTWREKFDIILANNAFAHIIDIENTTKAIQHCLKKDGIFIFEVHYLGNLINELQWDNIYHEHIYYYSVTSLHNLLKKFGMTIIEVEKISIHSGSIRVTAKKSENNISNHINKIIELESSTICNINYLNQFQTKVFDHIRKFNLYIEQAKSKGLIIAGYGASGRANMFCNITKLNSNIINFIVDDSPERCGRYIANTTIPIVPIEELKNTKIDLLIIFAWNYSKMIMDKTKFHNYKYMVAFPEIAFFNGSYEVKFNTL